MKVVTTGASGFVGKNLISYLNNLGVLVVKPDREQLNQPIVEWPDDIDAVIHLAGKAHDTKNVSSPDEYYQVNFELTKKLYNAFLNSTAKKFIFMSSVKAAADSVEGVLDENMKPDPQTHYGRSKLMAEQYIQAQPLPEGKSYYILRPCMIHGPGNKGNLNLLYKFVKKGIPYPLAGFKNKRSFLSVQNLCFVVNELLVKEDAKSGIYQVADDDALSTTEVVTVLASALHVKPRLWEIPQAVIYFLAKIGDRLHLSLTTERLKKLTENYVVSNNKIKQELNTELPLTAIDGLLITSNSFYTSY